MLPEPVLRRAQEAIWDLDGSGIGILEHSHRGPEFGRVLDRTEALVREVGGIGDDFAVMFVTAGATHHFAMVPENFLAGDAVADYCHTGVWSGKAKDEAARYGRVHVACSSEADRFASLPDSFRWSASARYAHYTSNETIYGTQWPSAPRASAPLVCDASSDIFSRPLALDGHGLIYAGAQKNLGPSGISLVIARRSFLATADTDLPPLARYATYAAEQSMHNTPNTFGIWMIGETCAWIREQGGLVAMAARNHRKAKLLYDFLDGSRAWRAHAQPGSRSDMNVTFRGASKKLEDALLARAEERGMSGLRGHRSVGGLRASIYNAFPEAGVRALVALLDDVEQQSRVRSARACCVLLCCVCCGLPGRVCCFEEDRTKSSTPDRDRAAKGSGSAATATGSGSGSAATPASGSGSGSAADGLRLGLGRCAAPVRPRAPMRARPRRARARPRAAAAPRHRRRRSSLRQARSRRQARPHEEGEVRQRPDRR